SPGVASWYSPFVAAPGAEKMPRARERGNRKQSPKRGHPAWWAGATNEVGASSRGHAHLRVGNTMEQSATATRGPVRLNYHVRGREGARAQKLASRSSRRGVRAFAPDANAIPLAGAPTSNGTSLRGISRSFPWCCGEAA